MKNNNDLHSLTLWSSCDETTSLAVDHSCTEYLHLSTSSETRSRNTLLEWWRLTRATNCSVASCTGTFLLYNRIVDGWIEGCSQLSKNVKFSEHKVLNSSIYSGSSSNIQ